MSFNIKGTLHKIGSTEHVSDRFSKREFIIAFTDNPKYPQFAKLEATGDKCSALDDFDVGDEVSVDFNIRGRIYTSKKTGEEDCFTSLSVWKLERTSQKQERRQDAQTPAPGASKADLEDVPF